MNDLMLGAFYQHLLVPVEAHLEGAKEVLIIPHKELFEVPWAALFHIQTGQYLIQRVAPSLRVARTAATATTDTGPEKEVQNFSAAVSAKAEGLENKSVKELREMCKAQILRKVRSIVIFFSKCTRALTFEDLWKEQGPRLLVVRRQA